jgi:chemotaxis protein MotB
MSARRRSHGAGPDRWLVSYADLVTLLLAFFTTLYAASTVDATRVAPLSSSVRDAFDLPAPPDAGAAVAAPPDAGAAVAAPPDAGAAEGQPTVVPPVEIGAGQAAMDELRRALDAALADAIAESRVEVTQDIRGLVVSMPDEAAFPSGGIEIASLALGVIDRVAGAVRDLSHPIQIEGHTDDLPIRTARYGSNWELSTARAAAVVAYLIGVAGVEPTRLSAAGYGEFHPRVPNSSAANRARNRRIEIVVLERPER